MADQADKPAPDKDAQDADNIFDSDIGDDWGEAFASEEDMFSSEDEASSSFFLDEKETTAKSPSPTTEKKVVPDSESGKADKTNLNIFIANLFHYVKIYKVKFFSLSRPIQIGIGAGLSCIILGMIFISSKSADKAIEPQLSTQLSTNKPVEKPPVQIIQTTAPIQKESHKPTNTTNSTPIAPPEAVQPKSYAKVSKKWHLPLFFLAIAGKNGKKSTILTVDLTLLLLLHQNELPPSDQQVLTRDIIFKFFNSKPLSEIQRYSLARGDMNRQLRSWIAKQLPSLPLEAITFNRYQIL